MSLRTFQFTVAAPSGAPNWFTNQSDKTWSQWPAKISDINNCPTYSGRFGSSTPQDLFAFSGGVADQNRKSLQVWGGGHSAGRDNGVYEFSLIDTDSQQNNPRWKTMVVRGDPIMPADYPWANWGANRYDLTYFWDRYSDGSPQANHSSNGANTQVWEPLTGRAWGTETAGVQQPVNSTWGTPNFSSWGYATPQAGTWTIPENLREPRINTVLGTTDTLGPAFYNPVQQHIYKYLRASANKAFSVDPLNPDQPVVIRTRFTGPSSDNASLIAAQELTPAEAPQGVMIRVDGTTRRVWLVSLSNYAVSREITAQIALPDGAPTDLLRPGAVWHAASNGVLLWNNFTNRAHLWKLSPDTSNAWTGAWTWRLVAPSASNVVIPGEPTPEATNKCTWGRFNLIRDVGGSGRDALVLVNSMALPTYVYKLPAGGV